MRSWKIVFPEPNRVELQEEEVPAPGPGQVRVRSHCTLLSIGTELTCLRGEFDAGSRWSRWVRYPFHPGYSNAGVVTDVGSDSGGFAVGDRVVTRSFHLQRYLFDAGDATRIHPIVRIPDAVDDEDAAWWGLSCIAQNGVRGAAPELGADVAVIGLGPIGQLVVQYSRLLGSRRIVAVDTDPRRLDAARDCGATHVLCCEAAGAEEPLAELTDGVLADVVYDVTGNPAALDGAIRLSRRLGRLILLGDAAFASEQRLSSEVIARGISIVGIHDLLRPAVSSDFAPWTHAKMAELYFELLGRGDMSVSHLVTSRYSPLEAPDVYAKLQVDRSGEIGILFDWRSLPE